MKWKIDGLPLAMLIYCTCGGRFARRSANLRFADRVEAGFAGVVFYFNPSRVRINTAKRSLTVPPNGVAQIEIVEMDFSPPKADLQLSLE